MSTVATTALAAAPVHDNVQSVYSENGYHVEYSMSGQNIVEHSRFTFSDSSTLEMTRVVSPNNTMTVTTAVNSGKKTNRIATGNYQMFYDLYQNQKGNSSIVPFGREIMGGQYKHIYVGSQSTDFMPVEEIRKLQSTAQLGEILATVFWSQPAALLSSVVDYITTVGLNNLVFGCEYIKINIVTYEVWFSFDNRYYTHCYHQYFEQYDRFRDQIARDVDYFQSVGG